MHADDLELHKHEREETVNGCEELGDDFLRKRVGLK